MKIWVDADACPIVVKEILYRAVERTGTAMTLVANRHIAMPPSRLIDVLRVQPGFDAADNEIVKRLTPGDLIITGDIPLAAEVLEKGAHALNPRGEFYTMETIRARLNLRDFMETLRASGIQTSGPPPLGQRERRAFASELDAFLARNTLST